VQKAPKLDVSSPVAFSHPPQHATRPLNQSIKKAGPPFSSRRSPNRPSPATTVDMRCLPRINNAQGITTARLSQPRCVNTIVTDVRRRRECCVCAKWCSLRLIATGRLPRKSNAVAGISLLTAATVLRTRRTSFRTRTGLRCLTPLTAFCSSSARQRARGRRHVRGCDR
jgi:hypothetical protein